MTTLQKFKLLATQCAVAGSPTRSPTTSPVIHLRRRKTLRMLLNRGSSGRSDHPPSIGDDTSPDRISSDGDSPEKVKELVRSHKLKDLLVSEKEFSPENDGADGGSEVRGIARVRSMRPLSATFRRRLLKRVWRPMLVSIPE
ncbi:putative peptide methionine sulfoxide reductase A4, chloroplastic-like [Capsicum annuum]|uniref:uncharacterized protein LOC107869770 n=1 Tax=Capsicum annuum TaxID=4072 RepID=UPI0007BF7A7E|nr:uncharacterized protein LOC107869770 [Capsicum annuum]KAF3627279.1 putative peptide methionine sulfoxide reductase A4, chloroplastic-like [Capsicum annuum]KAF3631779.1 putative peptide methionine sulfoxide reductase A4, chloroplastic-like [Capsicum annuum]